MYGKIYGYIEKKVAGTPNISNTRQCKTPHPLTRSWLFLVGGAFSHVFAGASGAIRWVSREASTKLLFAIMWFLTMNHCPDKLN